VSPPFTTARWLGNRHAQTVWGGLLRRRPRLARTHERWTLPDGESLRLAFTDEKPGRPGVLVLHGLEGSADARYVVGLLARITAAGWNAAAFDFRTCGPRPADPHARGMYHAGKTDDLAAVVERLAQRWAGAPLAAVGFSLGGNMLLKWLGETSGSSPLAAAVAVSVPFDLAACATSIDAPGFWPFVYRERFLRSLRRKALRLAPAYPQHLDAKAIRACRTLAAFDGAVIARVFGFASALDYWTQSSAKRFLAMVRRPTLLISGADDPFVPEASIPKDVIAGNPALSLALTRGGGHVGFVAGSPLAPRYVADDLAVEFLAARFAELATARA
jgi:predicted alpha/beta-fold hydrolase